LPPFEEYDMASRTYRYFTGAPLYPFGYGLSYTSFAYSGIDVPEKAVAGSDVTVKVTVTNTGKRAGDEVVQLYLTDEKASSPRPLRQLEGFKRIHLEAGESRTVDFTIRAEQFSMINSKDTRVIEPGWFTVTVGGKQPGFSGSADPLFTEVIKARLRLTGRELEVRD
jgi:beta-glucosidase